jgi:hypothetical protein
MATPSHCQYVHPRSAPPGAATTCPVFLLRFRNSAGGASALIASSALYIGPWYGFKFVLTVFFGCLAMLVVAMLVNNLSSRRRYPTYWLGK